MEKGNRYISLDMLRGVAIFGMIFSAIIPYGELPAWMYHIQNPPPTHQLDVSVSGIGWVDFVFPLFIFCMGVAIPLSGRKRLSAPAYEKTEADISEKSANRSYLKSVFTRFIMLWLFSYLYLFVNFSQDHGWQSDLATILGFALLFVLFFNYPKSGKLSEYKGKIKIYGWISIVTLILFGHFRFGEELSLNRSGIIIFLLAFLYLFGSLIWYYTRDNYKHRFFAFIAVLVFAVATMPFGLQAKLYAIPEIRWFFNMEYIYFLLIVIPATYIGDNLLKKRERGTYKREAILAVVAIAAGLLAMELEGSITKVPCTLSYIFVTFGGALFLFILSDRIAPGIASSYMVRIFAGAGENPLMSYVAFGSLVLPLMELTGFVSIYDLTYPAGYPWIGALRAFVFVLLTLALVAKLSEKKIYWRA